MAEDETIQLNGHQVPAHAVDRFLSGRTGEPISDADWDESKRRVAEAEAFDTRDDQTPVLVTWKDIDGEVQE